MANITAPGVTESTDEQVRDVPVGKRPLPSEIRLRAFIVGLPILLVNSFWVIMMEKVKTGPYPSTITIFANVVFTLAILAIINTILKKIWWKLAFSSAEMLVIYTMVAVGTALAGHDMIPNLVGSMGNPFRFGEQSGWNTTFLQSLPKSLSVTSMSVLKPLYEGNSSLYIRAHWTAWLSPALLWVGFITMLMFVMMCINTLVRKQWMDRERLTFPIVQLPLAMTEPKGELWRNKLFWMGFLIAGGIELMNGLAVYYPLIPKIAVDCRDLVSLPNKPWNAVGWTPYSFFPFVIGLGFLLPADLSFSCWFFYWFWKAQLVFSSMIGMDGVPDFPHVRHQAFGGYVAIIVMMAYASRGYLKQVWLRLLDKPSELDDSDEPLTYRTAVGGALIGVAFLTVFMWKLIGLSPWVGAIAFFIYFILATSIARMRAELGPPVHDLHFSGPDFMITSSGGLGRLSNHDLVGLTYFFWFNRAYRCHPMPIGIEGMKMAQVTKSSQQKFFWAVIIATVVGALGAFWADLHLGYSLGFSSKFHFQDGFAGEAFRNLDTWWKRTPETAGPNWGMNAAMLGGFGFCMLLGVLRLNVANFPFHPIGYAISGSWSMNQVWAPLMLAWIFKVTVLRFGGLKLYKKAVPLFLGLILGDMIVGCILNLVGLYLDIPYYNFWGG